MTDSRSKIERDVASLAKKNLSPRKRDIIIEEIDEYSIPQLEKLRNDLKGIKSMERMK